MKLPQIAQSFSQLSSIAFCPFLAKSGKTSYQITQFWDRININKLVKEHLWTVKVPERTTYKKS